MRDRTDESFTHIAEMNVEIASAGRAPGLGHVLREDVARANALHEHGAKIANQRSDEILPLERVSCAYRGGFLAQGTKHAANNFCLTIQIDQSLFDQTREL